MLVVVLVTTIVSFADLVASLIINSLAAALMSVGLCALGLILLIIDAVRERRRLVRSVCASAVGPQWVRSSFNNSFS
jgi:hypothetical protein